MVYPSRGRTPAEINRQQEIDAEQDRARRNAIVAASPQRPVPPQAAGAQRELVLPEGGDGYRQRYLDAVAGATGIVGRLIKFDKNGKFVTPDDGAEISDDRDFVVLADETLCGWIKFSEEEGAPPERHQGLLYDNYVVLQRATLGDLDQGQWREGLSGQPEDPWKHQLALVLQDRESFELYTFSAMSKTSMRCVGNLLKHYDRMQRSEPDQYPVVRLKAGGFNHRDTRVGWVPVPVMAVVGKAPKASAAIPDSSPAADMNDKIPF